MKQPFVLETSITTWRAQFKYSRRFSDSDLDEMERHIRDQVTELIEAGKTPKDAFTQAMTDMGGLTRAEDEYAKVHWRKVRNERRVLEELAVAFAMFANYIKLGHRNLRRDKVPSAINILGMSIALAICIVVYLFLSAWHSLDAFHENGDRLFFAQHTVDRDSGLETWGRMPIPIGPAMEIDIPQIERAVRLNWQQATVSHDGVAFDELVAFVDDGFLDILTFPLEYGSPKALADPHTVILSKKMAEKYFDDDNPVGETLTMAFGLEHRVEVIVGGVARAFPSNTGLRFGILMDFERQKDLGLADPDDWSALISGLIVQVKDAGDIQNVAAQMDRYLARQNASDPDWLIQSFSFERVTNPSSEAYRVRGRITESADPSLSIFFVIVALFMLTLSCFNYINITVGTASRRFKEIGMRKAIGGSRRQLIQQFITENILMCLIALAIGVILAKVLLVPMMNAMFILQIDLSLSQNLGLWGFLVGLLLIVATVSGAYRALYVSSFETISIFSGRQLIADNALLTRAFLTFQFVLAFITVIVGIVLTMNSRYMVEQDWGYNPGDTIVVELQEQTQYQPLRDALLQHPDVLEVGGAANHVGRGSERVELESPNGETQRVYTYKVGPNYMQTIGLGLHSGRLFDERQVGDLHDSAVVSERFVLSQGWDDALGKSVRLDDKQYTVIGVVEDFTFFFLAQPQPSVFTAARDSTLAYMALKVRDGSVAGVEAHVEETWARLFPDAVLTQFRQEEVFDQSYSQYNRVAGAFGYLAMLALLIACMGLFGLASQNVARRMKEVSIRKAVGASIPNLAFLVNRGFVVLLGVAAVIATGLCVIGINLMMSAVRDVVPIAAMPLTPVPFTIAYLVVFGTSVVAIGAHVYKIARANPAEVLRGEV